MSEYLDTSIVVKWFREGEEHREESLNNVVLTVKKDC